MDIIGMILELLSQLTIDKRIDPADEEINKVIEYAKQYDERNPKLLLLLMILTNIYFFDDLDLDHKEKKRIARLLQKFKKELSFTEKRYFRRVHYHKWTIKDIKQYIIQHNIEQEDIQLILGIVQQLCYGEWEYQKPFQALSDEILQ